MRSNRLWIVLSVPIIIYAGVLVIVPMAQMMVSSFQGESFFSNYLYFFQSGAYRSALLLTLLLSALVAVIVVCAAAILAWYLRFTRSRSLQVLILMAVMTPFMMGVVIKNYSLALIFQQGGVLSQIWERIPVIGAPVDLMYSNTAIVIGIAYSVLPFGFIPLILVFGSLDTSLIDASKMLGASQRRAFVDVVLPQIAPGVLASGAIVFMMSIGYYVTPVMLGGQGSPFLASLIHRQVFQQFDVGGASASGIVLVVAAVVVLTATVAGVGIRRLRRYV